MRLFFRLAVTVLGLSLLSPASVYANRQDSIKKLVRESAQKDFQKGDLPPLVLSEQEQDELINAFITLYKKQNQEVSREQAAVAVGVLSGYYAYSLRAEAAAKKAQQAPAQKPTGAIPEFDSAAHCKKVASVGGGSYALEAGCMDMEAAAKAEIAQMASIPEQVMRHCTRVTKAGGSGSYSLLQTCIGMELAAKQQLQKR